MRALVLAAPRDAAVVEVPRPEPGRGEALVRIEGCGVCGSNLPVWEGRPWFRYPLAPGAPGHEGWGRVAALGPGVDGLREGDRVAGLFGAALAEFDVAPASSLVPLPASLDGLPFPGEPFACALNAFRRARVRAGEVVAVVGVGFLGAVVAWAAVAAGARVLAIGRRPFALGLAARLGAEPIPLEGAAARVRAATADRGCDVAFEAAGVQETLDLAGDLVREQGRLVVAGFHQDGRRSVDLCAWNWKALEIVNAHFRDPAVCVEGLRAAVDAAGTRALDVRSFVTHAFPLGRAGEALDALRTRPDGFLKGVILP
jgi:threonine dehydrogenase-like Zn-dependent dehydrogenase